ASHASLPRCTAPFRLSAIRTIAASSASGRASVRHTAKPAAAATCAIPCPIVPAPITTTGREGSIGPNALTMRVFTRQCYRVAVERNCGRFEWSVLEWNTPAIDFYKSLGATPLDEWTVFRVTGDALSRLAAESPVRQ